MRTIGSRPQRTLAGPGEVAGVGIVTGAEVRLRFLPAAPDAGIAFRRTDLPGRPLTVARPDAVSGTERRTTLGSATQGVTLVEHVLSALAGLRIDNCTVELDGPEPPGLDGSARGFVEALTAAGTALQAARRPILMPDRPVTAAAGGASVTLYPAAGSGLTATYFLDYGAWGPIPRQNYTAEIRAETFVREVAVCRTFLTEPEAHALRAQGVGRHLTPADVLVFGPRGVVGNRLRFADEPARHKVLDAIGDLALCGFDLAGHLVACRSGHALNVELARRLVREASAGATLPVPARGAAFRRAA